MEENFSINANTPLWIFLSVKFATIYVNKHHSRLTYEGRAYTKENDSLETGIL